MRIKWFSWKRKNNIKVVKSKKDVLKIRINKPFLIEEPVTGILHVFKLTKWKSCSNKYKLRCSFINPNAPYHDTKYIRARDGRSHSLGFTDKRDLCNIIKRKNFYIFSRRELD